MTQAVDPAAAVFGDLAEYLSLPEKTVSFTLQVTVDQLPSVTAVYYPTENSKPLATAYKLRPEVVEHHQEQPRDVAWVTQALKAQDK